MASNHQEQGEKIYNRETYPWLGDVLRRHRPAGWDCRISSLGFSEHRTSEKSEGRTEQLHLSESDQDGCCRIGKDVIYDQNDVDPFLLAQ